MSEELVFYTNPMSRGRMIRWMLEEVGAPYRAEIMEYGTLKTPAYLAVNPMGKVPAITHRGQVVTEGAAICAYLADAFPDAGLAPPPTDPARAPYYRWLFFTAGPLEAAITNESLKVEVPEGRAAMVGYGTGKGPVLDVLEGALTGKPFIAGDRFSAADVYVGGQVLFGLRFGTIDPRPVFQDYGERLAARPAYLRASEMDDALLPKQARS